MKLGELIKKLDTYSHDSDIIEITSKYIKLSKNDIIMYITF